MFSELSLFAAARPASPAPMTMTPVFRWDKDWELGDLGLEDSCWEDDAWSLNLIEKLVGEEWDTWEEEQKGRG